MQMTVRDWMINLVLYVDPEATVTEALGVMRRRYVDSLIVSKTQTNPEVGIVTSIDICDKIVAQHRNPTKTKIKEIMNQPLFTVNQNLTIQECAAIMKEKRIHHLPVADDSGNLVGMIAATDFLVVAESLGHNGDERALS
ncbi:MAG: CBS domain-containing protein [Anaerolineaceae bacterium]|jgi:signal-transduction protein with cAMP-binding, CBS, and nucleotidyltransferase domain